MIIIIIFEVRSDNMVYFRPYYNSKRISIKTEALTPRWARLADMKNRQGRDIKTLN